MSRSRGLRVGRRRLVVVGALLCVAAPAWGAYAYAAGRQTTVVPRVGADLLTAYARLHAAGLLVNVPHGLLFDSRHLPRVLRVVPSPGRHVARGSAVSVYLAPTTSGSEVVARGHSGSVAPNFVARTVRTVYSWTLNRALAFEAYLGPLRAGAARGLLANYRVTSQRPAPGIRLRAKLLTVWGRQQAPASAPPPVTVTQPPGPTQTTLTQPAPPPPSSPNAVTGQATVSGQTGATVTGAVNPEAVETTYYFAYGTTDAYGAQTPPQDAGSGDSDLSATSSLTGLTLATTYHYRLVATSSAGTAYGADQTFTTDGYYQNAVFSAAPMPDPFVLDNGATHSDYWAFGTGDLFPLLHSTDLVHWTAEGTAMTSRPSWVTASGDWHPWGPSVIQSGQPCPGTTSNGCYVMYYGGLSAQLGLNCIGVATSPTPGGPYLDQGPLDLTSASTTMPLGCGDAAGEGNIDPSPFLDQSGQTYLYVSTDFSCSGNSCVLAPTISVIPLSSDLLHASGPRVSLFSGAAGTWEAAGVQAPTVEGPFMELHNGTYYLFYSGGSYVTTYGMGYATSTSASGPFTKSPANPILTGTPTVLSPGGGDRLVTGPHGGLWMLYAARDSSYSQPRTLWLDPFSWQAAPSGGAPDVPVIEGPTTSPQPTQP